MYHRNRLKPDPRNPLWIAAAGALGGGGYGITYLINDEFTTDRAAGSVNSTVAEPGPGDRETYETTGTVAITDGVLVVTGDNSTWNCSNMVYSNQLARAEGVALLMAHIVNVGNNDSMYGWRTNTVIDTSTSFSGHNNVGVSNGADDNLYARNSSTSNSPKIFPMAAYNGYVVCIAIIERAAGRYIITKPPAGDWILCWADTIDSTSVQYIGITQRDITSGKFDYIRAAQLSAPFDTANGIATDVHSGSVSAGTTFSHEADTWIEYTVTTRPTAGQTETRFRAQDASNYWQVTVDSSGNIDLDEVVSGTPTQRGTAAGVVSSGHRVCIVADDTTITVYSNDTQRFSYTSASNFKSATAGELETLGTGGAVSNLITMPRTLSGRAATILNAFAAGQS